MIKDHDQRIKMCRILRKMLWHHRSRNVWRKQ